MKTLFSALLVLALAGCGTPAPPAGRAAPPKIVIVQFADLPVTEVYRTQLVEGLTANRLVQGTDYTLELKSAQGEMSNLPQLVDAAAAQADLLITFQPQALYAALQRAPQAKKMFAIVSDPFVLGAGVSDTDHLPHITGQYLLPKHATLLELLRQVQPATRKLGVLYLQGEANAERDRDGLIAAAQAQGLDVVALPYAGQNEIALTATALTAREIDGIVHLPDSYYDLTLAGTLRAAGGRLPVWSEVVSGALGGAVLSCANNDEVAAKQFADMVARVIRGDDPGVLPFENNLSIPPDIRANLRAAQALRLTVPDAVLDRCAQVEGAGLGEE